MQFAHDKFYGRESVLLCQHCSQPHGSSRNMTGATCVVYVSSPGHLGLNGGSCKRRPRRITHRIGLELRYCNQEYPLCCRHLAHFPDLATQISISEIYLLLLRELRTENEKITGSLSSSYLCCYFWLEMDLLTRQRIPTIRSQSHMFADAVGLWAAYTLGCLEL